MYEAYWIEIIIIVIYFSFYLKCNTTVVVQYSILLQ